MCFHEIQCATNTFPHICGVSIKICKNCMRYKFIYQPFCLFHIRKLHTCVWMFSVHKLRWWRYLWISIENEATKTSGHYTLLAELVDISVFGQNSFIFIQRVIEQIESSDNTEIGKSYIFSFEANFKFYS